MLSKQTMHDISQGVEDCSFLVTSEGVKNFFKKDLEVSKKVVPLQRSTKGNTCLLQTHIYNNISVEVSYSSNTIHNSNIAFS